MVWRFRRNSQATLGDRHCGDPGRALPMIEWLRHAHTAAGHVRRAVSIGRYEARERRIGTGREENFKSTGHADPTIRASTQLRVNGEDEGSQDAVVCVTMTTVRSDRMGGKRVRRKPA